MFTPKNKSQVARWLAVLAPGLLLYFLPLPLLAPQQRHLFAVFVASIIALVSHPVPMGVASLLAITILALTRTVGVPQVFSGYSNATVWLVFTAFLFARAVTQTGFGMRVAYTFILRFGHSPLTLGYSVAGSDLVLAPFIPSDTARGGGIICPIIDSIARAVKADTGEQIGGFLTLVGFHTTYTASAMFLTGMAANPLIAEFAMQGAHLQLTWLQWALGAVVPGSLALVLLPWIIFRLHPPTLRNTEAARRKAHAELVKMGPLSRNEIFLVAILLLVMAGWVSSPWHNISNTIVALAGVSALLVCNVISWADLLSEHRAWESLVWFGALIMMADNLLQSGAIAALSTVAFRSLNGLAPMVALAALVTMYCYVHYGFASMTAQVTALYPPFLAAALATTASPVVAALSLAYFSNVNAAMTHYGTGSAPVYFGTGHVSQGTWWRVGFLLSLVNLALWLGVGLVWWKFLGWW